MGNHETFWEAYNLTNCYNSITRKHLLLNNGIWLEKYKLLLWGFPYTNRYGNLGFNVDDTPEGMGRLAGQIPSGTDIIISHGPIRNVNDFVDYPFPNHAGSVELALRVNQINPLLFLSGHLHDDRNYGVIKYGKTQFVGCSIANELYEMKRQPIIVEI